MPGIFETHIEYLKGVGPQRAEVMGKELGIFTFGDLIQYFPFRYEDRSRFYTIREVQNFEENVQIKGVIERFQVTGTGYKKRLTATFRDQTGSLDLVWFKGIEWIKKLVKPGIPYIIYGKPSLFNGRINIAHPEVDSLNDASTSGGAFFPVYHSSEKAKKRGIDSKAISRMMAQLFKQTGQAIQETLPDSILQSYHFIDKARALYYIHFPANHDLLQKARARLKFEELFFIQLKLIKEKKVNQQAFPGHVFSSIPSVSKFYHNILPFDLTGAQKRVIKEIRHDFMTGKQMNRLLQGDVGSGKTVVAFICMLMAIDNGTQTCLMAPTEILAEQHYQGLKEFADQLGISIGLLTGSVTKKNRKPIHESLKNGELNIIVGTHALLEESVAFHNIGFCVIDEQHRFGVAQRARLWGKNKRIPPHILVMTATPIPRTLAMTLYGDLDVSVIDELPRGRKPIETSHFFDQHRLRVFGKVKEEIKKGRQVYFVYPLIEESEKMDLKDVMDGYDSIQRAFPGYQISIVHGRMKPADKEYEMQRFVKGETRIMVATTVIEVGVNVPNATLMVIESAERFGLAQLHQLRGRVGRGAEQSYCILMTGQKLSKEGRKRMQTMVRTTDGFEIADVDLQLRGPGDLAGTQQSGVLDMLIADLAKDNNILTEARHTANNIIEEDPDFKKPEHARIAKHIRSLRKSAINWGRIS